MTKKIIIKAKRRENCLMMIRAAQTLQTRQTKQDVRGTENGITLHFKTKHLIDAKPLIFSFWLPVCDL